MQIHIQPESAQAPAHPTQGVFIKNYGCQMNVYDGDRIADLLAPLGYAVQKEPEGAALIVLNTCHIREKADDKLFSDIGRFRRAAAPDAVIAVGGCVGQAMGAKVMQHAPAVSVVFGPQTYHRLPALIDKVHTGRAARASKSHPNAPIRAVDTDFPELEKFDALPTPGVRGPSAFVTIQEGCDKFCTYCVVPYTRGAEISRPAAQILAEIAAMAQNGVREVTLLGQNVNAYEDDEGTTLATLCEKAAAIPGIARIRFTTSHPNNTTDDLIAAFATNPKLMPFYHLPVQAGANRILTSMNRNHTVESYLAVIEKVRAARPDIAISGDFIVGFPGETEQDFEETLKLAHAVGYVGAYSFAYSPRPGTPAANLPDQVDETTKKERLGALQAVLDATHNAFIQQFIGQPVEILVEQVRSYAPEGQRTDILQLHGRSAHNIPTNIDLPAHLSPDQIQAMVGQLVTATVTAAHPKSLRAHLT